MNEEDVNALNEDDFFLKLMQDSGLTVSLTVRYKIRSGIIMAQILIKYVLYLPYWKNIVSWHCKLKMIIFYYFKEKKTEMQLFTVWLRTWLLAGELLCWSNFQKD